MSYRYGRSSHQDAFSRNRPLTLDEIAQHAPSVLAAEPHHSRGERYTFIPTLQVLEGLQAEGFQPFDVRQTKCRIADKREFTKHLVRLRHPDFITSNAEVPEVVLVNSHDGTSSYQLLSGLFRWVCSNGLIAGDVCDDIKVRHSGNVVQDVIEGSFRVLDNIKAIGDRVESYKATRLDDHERRLFAQAAAEVRWGRDENGAIASPVADVGQLLVPRRYEDRGDDAWRTFNRVQESLVRGGLSGRSASGRRTTTRAINSVNEDVRVNRSLWTLIDGLVRYKNGEDVLAAA